MYTIKQAALRCGVPETSLRSWERRYAVVTPRRTESGYRLYDDEAVARLTRMRELVQQGWSPAAAAETLAGPPARPAPAATTTGTGATPERRALTDELLRAAADVDVTGIDAVLDRAFALGSFETVVDSWLMPALREVGEAWSDGRVDVAGEHTTSHAVLRRLAQAFAAARNPATDPRVVVGLPAGCHHELGALAFATALRRRGQAVVYVGADLPPASWVRAVRAFPTKAAVLGVPTEADVAAAAATVEHLRAAESALLVAAGGAHAGALGHGVVALPTVSIDDAARALPAA